MERFPSLQKPLPNLAACWMYAGGEESSNLKDWIHRLPVESWWILQKKMREYPRRFFLLVVADHTHSSSEYDISEGQLMATEAFKVFSCICDQLIDNQFSNEDLTSLPTSSFSNSLCYTWSCNFDNLRIHKVISYQLAKVNSESEAEGIESPP